MARTDRARKFFAGWTAETFKLAIQSAEASLASASPGELGDLFNALGAVDTEAVWLITREGDGYIVRIPHRDFRLAAVTEGQRLYGEFQERDDDPDDDEAPGKDIVDVTFDGDTFSGMLTLANGTRFPVQATRFQIGGGMQEQLAALVERLAVAAGGRASSQN